MAAVQIEIGKILVAEDRSKLVTETERGATVGKSPVSYALSIQRNRGKRVGLVEEHRRWEREETDKSPLLLPNSEMLPAEGSPTVSGHFWNQELENWARPRRISDAQLA